MFLENGMLTDSVQGTKPVRSSLLCQKWYVRPISYRSLAITEK